MIQTITEELLNSLKWIDISIQSQPMGKEVLILLCDSKAGSTKLHDILSMHSYDLKVWKQPDGNYGLAINFIESDFGLKIHTLKNDTNYPPVKKLHNQISSITTGVLFGGGAIEVHSQVLRLGELNIEKSLGHANEVHFIADETGRSPSAVVLIFESYDHILGAEAHSAFNKLVTMCKGNPILEISPVGGFIKLKIWDILIDLDVNVSGLRYAPQQLEDFVKRTAFNESFAFVLGLPPSTDGKHVFAPSSKKGMEIITIKGYKFKTEK